MEPALRITTISVDWTDTGAVCLSSVDWFSCPRCAELLRPNIEHRCGDRVLKAANVKPTARKRHAGGKEE